MVASKSLITLIFLSLYINWIIASPISQNRLKRQAGEGDDFGSEPESEHGEGGFGEETGDHENDDFGEDNDGGHHEEDGFDEHHEGEHGEGEEGEHGGHHGEHGHEHGDHHEQSEEQPRRSGHGASNHNEFNVKQEAEGGASVTITNSNN